MSKIVSCFWQKHSMRALRDDRENASTDNKSTTFPQITFYNAIQIDRRKWNRIIWIVFPAWCRRFLYEWKRRRISKSKSLFYKFKRTNWFTDCLNLLSNYAVNVARGQWLASLRCWNDLTWHISHFPRSALWFALLLGRSKSERQIAIGLAAQIIVRLGRLLDVGIMISNIGVKRDATVSQWCPIQFIWTNCYLSWNCQWTH